MKKIIEAILSECSYQDLLQIRRSVEDYIGNKIQVDGNFRDYVSAEYEERFKSRQSLRQDEKELYKQAKDASE